MLLLKDGNIELHRMDKESYDDLSADTLWNIPQFEYEEEVVLILKTPNKKLVLRAEYGLYYNEKNILGGFDKVLAFASEKIADRIRIIINDILIDTLIKQIDGNKIDYNKIKEDNILIIQNPEEVYHTNFLITARGRGDFAQPMYNSFRAAADKSQFNITYTVVEHSEFPEHLKFCKKNKLNYIWIKSAPDELFNKCLSYNMGVFFGNKSKYLLFHDIDCLVQSDFFLNLFDNISHKQCRALQCFTGRRVLYINKELTIKIISGEFSADELSLDMSGVDLPKVDGKINIGAPGGSIMIERDLYFEVGGYDAELFLDNSPEDAFFWTKVDTIDKMYISDDPNIELYHMYHPPSTSMHNSFVHEMQTINNNFNIIPVEYKKSIIAHKANMIKKFK